MGPPGPWPLLIWDSRVSPGYVGQQTSLSPDNDTASRAYVTEDSSGSTSNQTRPKSDTELLSRAQVLLGLL